MNASIVRTFHLADGWFFSRLSDGTVRIQKRKASHEQAPLVAEALIGADSWASIVASVSAAGESGNQFRQALAFHAGEQLERSEAPSHVADEGRFRKRSTRPSEEED